MRRLLVLATLFATLAVVVLDSYRRPLTASHSAATSSVTADTLSPRLQRALDAFDTDLSRRSIDLSSLRPGGPPKDGIPSIDRPRFISPEAASGWLNPKEPVLFLSHRGDVRGYPLQILIFHEIVNDDVGGTPVAVTFCPLCYSAIAFVRCVNGESIEFGVSGLLRKSDLVMYDRSTESLWQQFTGRAIVGTLTGTRLEKKPSQIISFQEFRSLYPHGRVLSRDTGFDRPYGQNPYAGYDDIDSPPFAFHGEIDDRLRPMMKVIAVAHGDDAVAIPHSVSRSRQVIEADVGGLSIVAFHVEGAVSAVDARRISRSSVDGTVGVFEPTVGEQRLTFQVTDDGTIVDHETRSEWSVTGRALAGPLQGEHLPRVEHGSYFAFAWLAFRPETRILK